MLKKVLIVLALCLAIPSLVMAGGSEEAAAVEGSIEYFLLSLDNLDWEAARALMCEEFYLDYSSFGGGDPATLSPDDVLGAWQGLLPGFDNTHHLLGGISTWFEDGHAYSSSHITATHYIADAEGGDLWTVYGTYDFVLAKNDGLWQLSGLTFNFEFLTGNPDLPAIAGERAADL